MARKEEGTCDWTSAAAQTQQFLHRPVSATCKQMEGRQPTCGAVFSTPAISSQLPSGSDTLKVCRASSMSLVHTSFVTLDTFSQTLYLKLLGLRPICLKPTTASKSPPPPPPTLFSNYFGWLIHCACVCLWVCVHERLHGTERHMGQKNTWTEKMDKVNTVYLP